MVSEEEEVVVAIAMDGVGDWELAWGFGRRPKGAPPPPPAPRGGWSVIREAKWGYLVVCPHRMCV
jgi:hypothetical protein